MKNDFQKVIKSQPVVLIQFYAIWSADCNRIFNTLKDCNSIINGKISLLRINIKQDKKMNSLFNVESVPCLQLFQNGILKLRYDGPVNRDQLISLVETIEEKSLKLNQQ